MGVCARLFSMRGEEGGGLVKVFLLFFFFFSRLTRLRSMVS